MLFGQIILVRNIFMSYTHGMIIGQGFWIKEKEYKSWRIYLIFRALATNTQNQIKQRPKHSQVFVKPQFIMIYHLKCCAMKIRVWQTYPPYKNLVPEIPKLGAERSMETWIWGSLHVLMLLLLPCGSPLILKYMMVWLCVWCSAWSRLLMASLQ